MMERMFRVLGFWTFVIGLMFLAGRMIGPAIIFGGQTLFFVGISYLKFQEKTYLYYFCSYMVIAFCVMVWYATFVLN